ncbi:PucR family transcriptional regulator [Rhodococcus daqingensis]|uniref:PucR family transcriptional regulator n=1 Tax=Rhodococcus daqingensis TaxID=2479363 RepID=A0ABW2S0F1_9NOCA
MPTGDIEQQMVELGTALYRRADELGQAVANVIAAEVDFYASGSAVTSAELAESCKANLRFIFSGLQGDQDFDTTPARATGIRRAKAGVPLAAVMEAYRVAFRLIWEAMLDESRARRHITAEAILRVTGQVFLGQDTFTQAMSSGYREQQTRQVLQDEAERAALVEALLEGRIVERATLWEVAEILRIPTRGTCVVVAADVPAIGRLALPDIEAKLRSLDLVSAWRLLPDIQIGIVCVSSDRQLDALIELLNRVSSTRVGVSPRFDDITRTADAVRYARAAMAGPAHRESLVTVFEDSLISIAAISSPELMKRLAEPVLAGFDDLSHDDRQILFDTFRQWIDHDGSVTDAAAQLFCHPNTVRHRLRRIEERTGRLLSRPRDVAELCMVFEVDRRLGPAD